MTGGPCTLALGGGGARGLAHLGAIEVLGDAGIPIERYVGVSIGGILGALAAFEPDIRAVQQRVQAFLSSPPFQRHQTALYGTSRRTRNGATPRGILWFNRVKDYVTANRLVHRVMIKPAFLPLTILDEVVKGLLPDADIADAKTPLTIVAVDLRSGRRVALERGPLRAAVMGSAALPGIFPPVPFQDLLLSDVGVFCPLPTGAARAYAPSPLVAIDVSPEISGVAGLETALDVMMRMEEIGGTLFRDYVLSLADIVIRPDVGALEWSDFSGFGDVVEQGRVAARAALPRVLERLSPERLMDRSSPTASPGKGSPDESRAEGAVRRAG